MYFKKSKDDRSWTLIAELKIIKKNFLCITEKG